MSWRLRLCEFDFEIKYRKAKAICQADAMWRMPAEMEAKMELDEEMPSYPTRSHNWRSMGEAEVSTQNTEYLLANNDDAELDELPAYVTIEELIQCQ